MDEDYPARPQSNNLCLKPELIDVAHKSSTLETDVYVRCYTLLVVYARKAEDEDSFLSVLLFRHKTVVGNGEGAGEHVTSHNSQGIADELMTLENIKGDLTC